MHSVLNGLAGIYREKTDPRWLQCQSSLTLCHLPGHRPAPHPQSSLAGALTNAVPLPQSPSALGFSVDPAGGGGPSLPPGDHHVLHLPAGVVGSVPNDKK